jgi:phage terminase large subunit
LEWEEDNVEKGVFEYDPVLPLYVAYDFGKTDSTAIIWAQKTIDGRIRIIDTYTNTGKNIDFYVPFVTGTIRSIGYVYSDEELDIIHEHADWKPAVHFGDPAGRFVNQVSDETVFTVLRNHGIYVNFKEMWKHFSIRKEKAKRLILDGIELNNTIRNEYFDMQMINASYPKAKVEGMEFYRTEKPRHDNTSHYRTAFEYLAMGLEEFNQPQLKPYDRFKKTTKSTSGVKAYRRATSY